MSPTTVSPGEPGEWPRLGGAESQSPAAGEADRAGKACADTQTLAVLELPAVLERLASLAQSRLGAERCRELRPCSDPATVSRRQRRLAQLLELLEESSPPWLARLDELPPLLSRLGAAGAMLSPEELGVVAEFLSAVSAAASFLDPTRGRHDELFRLRNRITPLPELADRLRRLIGPGGEVRSDASPELARLRRELARQRRRLRSRLEELAGRPGVAGALSDRVVTQRAGRYVLPVRSEAKGRLPGIIHDTSGSGRTCFVEPLEVVEDNNRLALLERRERREVERILQEATAALSGQLQALREDLAALAQLDCLLAQAELARRLEAVFPRPSPEGEVELIKARHPLLAWRQASGGSPVVPIDLRLGGEFRVLVLSGANAGGKTAALKTLGLIALMAQCGLAVPCDPQSRLPVFAQVLAEAGDEQDLEDELSTFTAHAGRLAHMARNLGPGTLVLVDELGAGTDPEEGAALGMAFLEWCLDRGALALATTHFHALKAFAQTTEGAANASVAFHQATGRPTYQIAYGRPGFSEALVVAEGLGFPPRLLARARSLVDQTQRRTAELLRRAEQLRQEAERDRAAAARLRAEAERLRQEAARLKAEAQRQRAEALPEGKRRVREVARRLQQRLEELLAQVEEQARRGEPLKPGAVRSRLHQARRQAHAELDQALAPSELEPDQPTPEVYRLRAGDPVRLVRLGREATLAETPRPGMETVHVNVGRGGLRLEVPLREIAPAPKRRRNRSSPRPGGVSVQASSGDGLELDLIGLTVEEAIPKVDKALDQAVLAGRPRLTVVHGVGTGRLRRAVRDYLAGHPLVTAVRPGEGLRARAVTVAELRD